MYENFACRFKGRLRCSRRHLKWHCSFHSWHSHLVVCLLAGGNGGDGGRGGDGADGGTGGAAGNGGQITVAAQDPRLFVLVEVRIWYLSC